MHSFSCRACASETDEIVEFMLSKSANQPLPNLKTGDSPLHVASEKGNMNIARHLLRHSPKLLLEQSSTQKSALHFACEKGYRGVVEVILEYVCQLVKGLQHVYNEENMFSLDFRDSDEVTPFFLACLNGFADIVRQFLAVKCKLISLAVNAAQKNGHTPLHAAAYSGNSEVVELLLSLEEIDAGSLAPPIMETKRILWQAIGGSPYEDIAIQKIFVSATGAFIMDVHVDGLMKGHLPLRLSPLAEACAHNHAKVVEALLRHGVRDEDGLACRVLVAVKQFELFRKLLAYHCKVSKSKIKRTTKALPEDMWSLDLCWDSKKLPLLKRECLGNNAIFHPTIQVDEFDDATDRHRGQHNRGSPTASIGVQLPQRIDHCFIRSVTLQSNCLKVVPLELFQLRNVITINLCENQLATLPTDRLKEGNSVCGWECKKLKELKVSGNMLTELPLSLWLLPELKTIEALNNNLTKFVGNKVFSTLNLTNSLDKVDFSHNNLTEIDFITEFPSLRVIVICYNRLTTIPLALWDLDSLQELKVSNNCITALTPPIETLEEIDELPEETDTQPAMIGATRVTGPQAQFRPQMSHCLSVNPQKSIDEGLLPGGIDRLHYSVDSLQECSNLKKLDLSCNQLEEFPHDLPCLAPSLVELNVSNNPLREVELRLLPPTLKKLNAKNCQIERFGTVQSKEQLKTNMHSCVRKEFRDQPCQHHNHTKLTDLTSLNLKQNRLTHFQVLYHMPSSKDAPNFGAQEDTYQKEVAVSDLLYPSLENLDLSENRLEGQFNPNIAHLTAIKAIQLNGNEPLQKIPYELGHLKKMKGFTELNISNLPNLVQPPKDIQGHMCQQLLAYLAAGLRQ